MKKRAENSAPANSRGEFDVFASTYLTDLHKGVSLSGESSDFFAEKRVAWMRQAVSRFQASPAILMDFGCGIGATTPVLRQQFSQARIIGVDTSAESIAVAQTKTRNQGTSFELWQTFQPQANIDLLYTNGVFHHIPPEGRAEVVRKLRDTLRPNGLVSLWENNPWNPGTRWVMSRIPFDRDAKTLTYRESKWLFQQAGFEILEVSFHFIFPKLLSALRVLERPLRFLPLGAQYHILCRKP